VIEGLNPAFILLGAALLVPLVPQAARRPLMLAAPLLGLAQLLGLPHGAHGVIDAYGLELVTLRVDALSVVFGVVFHLAALLGVIYALHVRDTMQHVAALVYAGATVGALLAGDLVTLFIYWELTAVSSVFLVWARRTETAFHAGLRYLIIQVLSGVLLLGGAVVYFQHTGSAAFGHIGLDGPGGVLIFLAFGIKCAFPLLHNWLHDAYPEATVTGTVILSAFTTKLAVYALARGFAGEELLITIGAVMAAFPVFYALLENDLRRTLSYSLNIQLGFMVVGIGVGTELAVNGAAAHAFTHVLYKALLFMSTGAVLYRAGTIRASELGGLYKSMPWTTVLCLVGAASIAAFPLMSGFVSKSLILSAAAKENHWAAFLVLLFASASVMHYCSVKVPFYAFFNRDSGIRCEEAPANMLVAMGAAALLCIGLGVYPAALYALLPHAVDYNPYTLTHVVTQLQLLMFSILAFTVLWRLGVYPAALRSVNLDSDWLYRRGAPAALAGLDAATRPARSTGAGMVRGVLGSGGAWLRRLHGPGGPLAGHHTTSGMLLVVLGVFVLLLLIGFLG